MTVKGLRDRAILAVLLGCGLRRSEVAALTFSHVQQRDGRWCIVDLKGKHGRIRTVPMPTWVKTVIDSWTFAGRLSSGNLFRAVDRADQAAGEGLGEKVVWQMLRQHAAAVGAPGIAPSRPPSHLRQALPRGWRGPRADSVAPGARISSDNGTVSRHETRSGPRAERCDQIESGG